MAKFNQSATLNCTSRCSGLMAWIQPRNRHVTVAWCNQTSCRSEEGYEVSHDRYLKGDLSLTITKADYSKRTWYTCQCDGTDVCHVTLRIEPVEFTRQMNPGEPLYLDLPITENVKVTFNKRGDTGIQSPVPVCTVDGRKVHCDSEYKTRASLKSSLTLTEVKESDIGVYTVQDTDNDEVIATYHVTGSTPAIMHLCAGVILLLVPCVVLSVDRQKVFGNLHESASLPCTVQCSGELTWTRFQKQDDVLVRCSSVSCRSKDGFILSYEQYLKGNSSLTMLKADYSLRGLYMAKCVSETVCEVVFTLSPLEMTRVIAPGEPIHVFLPHTDLVGVSFTASDAVQPSNLQICIMDKEKIQCIQDYKERASLLNTLQIKDGNVSDSGNYIVQDKVNDETLAIVTVHMREPCPDIKQQEGVPAWGIVLILMVLLLVSVLAVVSVMHVRLRREVQQLRENAENNGLPLLQQNGNGNHPGEESNLKEPLGQVQSV